MCINCIHIYRKMFYAKTIDMSRKLAMSLSTRYIKKTTWPPVSLKTVRICIELSILVFHVLIKKTKTKKTKMKGGT